jgi:hypothetical protein
MPSKTLKISAAALSLATLLACGEKPAEQAPAEQAAPAEPAKPAEPPPPAVPEVPAVPAGAKVSFIEPSDGAKIEGPLVDGKVKVAVKMGAENIAVKPAGAIEAGTGHHHLLVDVEPGAKGEVVGADEQHIHYGKGQTEAEIALAPGEHTLRLQFADGIHRSYGSELSATSKITVAEAKPAEEEAPKGKKGKAAKTKK